MLKIQIINSLPMQWESGYKNIFPDAEWVKNPTNNADVHMFMWCDNIAVNFINNSIKNTKYVVFIRRYEYYTNWIEQIDWSKVDEVICVNDFIAEGFEKRTGKKPHVIYNGVSIDEWGYKERQHGNKIAMVGYINQKKNIPLAIQILRSLPNEYELYIAGDIQDGSVLDYMKNVSEGLKIFLYGKVDDIDGWLEDKNYILSCAISEGSPNNVIEAMAKGIKPIVHNWPGAKEQFGIHVFNKVEGAVNEIKYGAYTSELYRKIVKTVFGIDNFKKVKDLVDKCVHQNTVVV